MSMFYQLYLITFLWFVSEAAYYTHLATGKFKWTQAILRSIMWVGLFGWLTEHMFDLQSIFQLFLSWFNQIHGALQGGGGSPT